MDRSLAPPISLLADIPFAEAKKIKLSDNVEAYLVEGGKKNIIRLQTYIKAGRWHEPQKLVAQICARMLKEGTKNYTAKALAEKIDFYGATISTKAHFDYVCITLYTLKKFLPQVLELQTEILTNAIFPEKELNTIINNSKQQLKVNLEKTDYLASTAFLAEVFGDKHPYGYEVSEKDYSVLEVETLKKFYRQCYHKSATVYICGKFNEQDITVVQKSYTSLFNDNSKQSILNKNEYAYHPTKKTITKPNCLQAAIRIGGTALPKTHKDRFNFNILNIILGGYFGSRLMKNIREEKGYTYSINSGIQSYLNGNYFLISTEVGKEVCDAAVNEIFTELNRLQNEVISDSELQLVKNFICGALLRLIDGPFKAAGVLKDLYDFDLNTRYFANYINKVKNITAEELLNCAQTHLKEDTLTQVIARC